MSPIRIDVLSPLNLTNDLNFTERVYIWVEIDISLALHHPIEKSERKKKLRKKYIPKSSENQKKSYNQSESNFHQQI